MPNPAEGLAAVGEEPVSVVVLDIVEDIDVVPGRTPVAAVAAAAAAAAAAVGFVEVTL